MIDDPGRTPMRYGQPGQRNGSGTERKYQRAHRNASAGSELRQVLSVYSNIQLEGRAIL